MRWVSLSCVVAALGLIVAGFVACHGQLAARATPAAVDESRRDRQDPELIVESGGRMGACDQLAFTPDGKQLVAVGDDKNVRVWKYADGKLDPKSRVLRWSIWREQRGAIYALAVSPKGDRVAVGGVGSISSSVAVLDLADGHVIDMVVPKFEAGGDAAVMEAAFSPSGEGVAFGTADGSVWLWDFKTARLLGKHDARGNTFNRVRLVRFSAEDRLLTLAEDGVLLEWDPTAAAPAPKTVQDLKLGAHLHLFRAELSPDADNPWLAAAPNGPRVAYRSLDGAKQNDIDLKPGEFARAIAFDPKHHRLAVAVGSLVAGARFYVEADDRIVLYDLDQSPPKATPGPQNAYRADRLTFSPDGNHLAVAGGDDHEVTLWDLDHLDKPASVMRGAGASLWDVSLAKDGKSVGFRDQRNPTSADLGDRGRGPSWRAFDLTKRQWLGEGDFKPTERLTTTDGWTVEPDGDDPFVWWVVHKPDARLRLPLDKDRDGLPRCYTFIEGGGDGPVRLAVGHDWGFSVLDVTKDEVRRTRLCIGHQGEVTALAVSADRSWMVSASVDQTITAWSLNKEWPSKTFIGASFETVGDHLVVKAVDAGSPAWEAGLAAKDEVTRFGFGGKWVDDGDPKAWLRRLARPVPGLEHAFQVKRDGRMLEHASKTTLKQRPLWRFFPTTDGEWVLWMWRNSFYDTSTKGDFYLGWHVNSADLKGTPTFYRAEQFRKYFHRPDVINKLLLKRDPGEALGLLGDNPVPLRFDEIEPPAVELRLAGAAPGKDFTAPAGKDIDATLLTTSRGANPDLTPVEAEVWINDFRLAALDDVKDWTEKDRMRSRKLTIPYEKLRAGVNVVTFQTYNRKGGRSDTAVKVVCNRPAPDEQRLVGLAVGINNYSAAKLANGKRALGDLANAVNDADGVADAWGAEKLFRDSKVTPLVDPTVTRQAILDALDALAKTANPDDCCLIFLAGHGDFRTEDPDRPGGAPRSVFVFCPPDYDPQNPYKTGITNDLLNQKLAAIPCRKVLILDACHAGAAVDNPARGFAPGGQGPIILSACDLLQSSHEDDTFRHGLFTYAILEVLTKPEEFKKADLNHDKLLDSDELYRYTRKRMPELLAKIHVKETAQVPILFTPDGEEDVKLARGPAAAPEKPK